MPDTGFLHGRQIVVSTAEGEAVAVAIPKQRSMELTRNGEMREKASNNNHSQEFTPGRDGWTLTVSGLMSQAGNGLSINTKYTITIDYGGSTESGEAYCSQLKVTGVVGNLAQQSAVFTGTGPLASVGGE